MKVLAPWVATMVVYVFMAGCGGQEETGEKGTAGEGTTEKTIDRAEATAEVTTATTAVAPSETEPEPIRDTIEPQKEERANASPEEATGEGNQAQRESISVTHEAAPDPATVGGAVTFTIVVTNNSQPQHVGFKDFFPPSMTLVSATPGQGYCGPPHHGGNLFDCTLGVIPTGGSVVVEVVAVPTVPGTVTNTAQAGGGFAPVESVPATVTVNP
jgi:uncharacterized repeat protein (TIGR01451 family)